MNMRIIEFAVETNETDFSPCVILLDCAEIVGFEQIPGVKDKCNLLTKQGRTYKTYGTYRTLTNRFLYALNKKHNLHEDNTIRPSIRVFHRPELLEPDISFFDKTQLKAFIFGVDPDFNVDKLPEYTREELGL